MSIRILTDSACDLPIEVIQKHNIDVVPLLVYLDDIEYRDGETIKSLELYKNMREGKVYKTAQVSPKDFVEKFTEYAENGDQCIYIAFSSGLSGTYNSSLLAKNDVLEKYPDFDIEIIDTKCASMGFGLVVNKAGQMLKEGKSKDEIVEAVKYYSTHVQHIFTVDDLEYLYRGGRVSRTSAFVGGLLNIKPILDVEDGKLAPVEKIRGRNKVLKRMIEIIKERGAAFDSQTIGISHGDDLETALNFREMMEESLGCKDFIISMVGCSVGAHSGPGTLAIFFLDGKAPM